jgi:hypothetical protein
LERAQNDDREADRSDRPGRIAAVCLTLRQHRRSVPTTARGQREHVDAAIPYDLVVKGAEGRVLASYDIDDSH